MVKKNACVFISGSGTNLNALIKSSREYNFPINIKLIISNKKNAAGLNFAKKFLIPFKTIDTKNSLYETMILNEIKKKKISLICLAGYMKIISKNFLKKYRNKIINIHPSLLPKYKGLNTHQRAIDNKEKYSGCTVHYVNSKLDSGRIILQKKVKILKTDTSDKLAQKILKQEHILYPKALKKVLINL